MTRENHKELISILNDCTNECNRCASACLEEQDIKMLAKCVKLDVDCAEICQLAVSYLSRDSQNAEKLLEACAAKCEDCAKECEKHHHMEHCKRCADVCRKCAELCLQPV